MVVASVQANGEAWMENACFNKHTEDKEGHQTVKPIAVTWKHCPALPEIIGRVNRPPKIE
jgi:hypothetical protein